MIHFSYSLWTYAVNLCQSTLVLTSVKYSVNSVIYRIPTCKQPLIARSPRRRFEATTAAPLVRPAVTMTMVAFNNALLLGTRACRRHAARHLKKPNSGDFPGKTCKHVIRGKDDLPKEYRIYPGFTQDLLRFLLGFA